MRPLTYVYDKFDSGFTLNPIHFLMSHFEPLLVSASNDDGNDDDYCIVKDSTTALLDSYVEERPTTAELLLASLER